MTLDQLIIASALWCAPEAFKLQMGLINDCRKDLITCVQAVAIKDKDYENKIRICFLEKKI